MLVRKVKSIRLEGVRGKRRLKKILNVIKIDIITITKTNAIALNRVEE